MSEAKVSSKHEKLAHGRAKSHAAGTLKDTGEDFLECADSEMMKVLVALLGRNYMTTYLVMMTNLLALYLRDRSH